jgi:hypothetical protein
MIRILEIKQDELGLCNFENIFQYNTHLSKTIYQRSSCTLGPIPDLNDIESGACYYINCNISKKNDNINKFVTGFINRIPDFELKDFNFIGTAYLTKMINGEPDFIKITDIEWIISDLLNYTKDDKFNFDVSVRVKNSDLYITPDENGGIISRIINKLKCF